MRATLSTVFLTTLAITAGFAFPANAKNITGDKVVLRTLDKVTATTKDYTISIGDTFDYGSLKIDVKHCETRPPEDIPETYAFLQIFERGLTEEAQKQDPQKLFSGWMLASKPAISALDHPVYDVWVIGCESKLRGLR